MNNQEIIYNAPDLIYTHYSESQSIYIKSNFDAGYTFKTSGKTGAWIGSKLGLTRSLSDIKRIVELEANQERAEMLIFQLYEQVYDNEYLDNQVELYEALKEPKL
jgi:hypothetical protein